MITSANDVWAPFVDLNRILNDVVLNKDSSRLADLENLLKRHKPDFISLLKNASPSEADRGRLKKATVDGIRVDADSSALQILPQTVVDEVVILSDLFQLNELVALRLLQTGEAHMSHYPGLTRGLTAVLLYYDGRRALVNSFRLLLQARRGVTWNCDLPDNVTDTITQYTETLLEENMVNKILDLLSSLDWEQELTRLNAACALGSHRQLRQVLDMYQQTRQNLADALFCWSAQSALPRRDAQRILHYLTQMEPSDPCGRLDGVQLSLLMSVMYSLSPLRILRLSDAEEQIRSWPVLADPDYLPLMHKQLFVAPASWKCPQLLTILQLVWAVTLTSLRTLSFSLSNSGIANVVEEDETIMDVAICDKVFLHIREIIVACETFFEEEFHVRFVHDLLTEMLVAMPLKVKELRNRADEAARTKQMHQQEGLEPPSNLPQHFEQLLQLLSAVYEGDRLSLSLDYWAIDGTSQRQAALNKFVRVAGDLLPAPLYVPYLQLLTALSGSVGSAQHCYTMLTSSVHTVTISRLFSAFHTYHNALQYNVTPIYGGNPLSADTRPPTKQLSAHELHAMLASLKLICVLAEQDVSCRVSMFEKPGWSPLPVFVSLLRHAVPTLLKAQLLRTLTAFARSPELAAHLWHELEAAQILQTTASSHPARGILMELEEVESRAEQFPQARAFIGLLSVLVEGSLPLGLGTGTRVPGLNPYLNFVVHDVLVNFNSRAYKDAAEKYEVGAECVQFLLKVVELWDGSVTDPTASGAATRPVSPGETVLLHMMQESKLLRLVLYVLEDGVRLLDAFSPFPGRQQLQRLSLLCLQLVDACLSRQSAAMPALRHSCSAPLLPGLDALLLATNPRTGAADGLLVFTKYVSYGGWLPDHACHAVSALTAVCRRVSAQQQLIALLCRDRSTQLHATHAFVECLDVHTPEDDGSPVHRARCSVLQLLISGLQLPGTSVAHLLLGMPLAAADHQDMRRRTCLHAIMDMLSQGLTAISPPTITERCPAVANMAYQVVYLLCASPLTSAEALRFLRSTHDFIYSQLRPLPASTTGLDALRHTTWLLKMAAIEIKTTASGQQRSHLSRLTRLLLDSCPALAPAVDLTALDMSLTLNQALTGTASTLVGGSGQRRKLVSFLNAVDFSRDPVHQPNWEYFDPEQISKAISECEMPGEGRQVDVKRLHSLLMAELAALQGTAAVSQRQYILHEVKAVLLYCVERNGYASWVHCSCQCMNACRQLLETMLTAVPVDQLSDSRDQVLIDLTRHVLNKTVDGRCATELAGTLLLLTTCLRAGASTPGAASCSAAGRQAALRGVVDTLLGWESGGGQLQTGRAHLYGALLQLLLPAERQLLAAVCRQYGPPLLDALCRDATSGHQIGRMLAMCCLDAMLRLSDGDVSSAAVEHVLGCGFVSAVCAAVTSDADALVACVRGAPTSLRPLYIYDAQMALLCCVAGCADGRGASALLRTQLLVRLAELSALGQLPGPRAAGGVRARYRQLLLPVLRLCSALLTSSSVSNNAAAAQVMQFLLSHMDLIASLLQYEPTDCSTDHLQVVGLLTSVLSLVLAKDPGRGDVVGTSMQGQYSRLRQLVTTQLCRELAAPPSSSVDSNSSDATSTKANGAHLKVVCQLLSCYQCLVVQSGLLLPRLLFVAVEPSITAAAVGMSRDCGFLGVLVLALRHYCRLLNTSCRRLEQLQLAASDQQQLAQHHPATTAQHRPQLTELSTAQVSMVRHILETLLFLVWTHLDYVFKFRDFGAGFDNEDVTPVLIPNEMALLKKSVPLTVTDPLLDQLQTTLKDPTTGAGHFSFSEAMIRRIRRLVKLSIH